MAHIETQTTTSASIQIKTDEATLGRILAGYERDKQEFTKTPDSLNEWILGIVLDWIEEVEKPVPQRDIGFGN